ncbi:hypothetical protein [Burkholderia sp. PAMC 26561]|uniref:hypothetical protein n=1 Tax=Burkholderia sp. PAMC 26561 TaxID=1795043 RepID=UPI0013C4CD94|nr:hypothetical protein [Burkholderia sp. PAMC 26561]
MNRYPNLFPADVDFRRVTNAAALQRDRIRVVAKAAAGSMRNVFLDGCGDSFARKWLLDDPISARRPELIVKAKIGNRE